MPRDSAARWESFDGKGNDICIAFTLITMARRPIVVKGGLQRITLHSTTFMAKVDFNAFMGGGDDWKAFIDL